VVQIKYNSKQTKKQQQQQPCKRSGYYAEHVSGAKHGAERDFLKAVEREQIVERRKVVAHIRSPKK